MNEYGRVFGTSTPDPVVSENPLCGRCGISGQKLMAMQGGAWKGVRLCPDCRVVDLGPRRRSDEQLAETTNARALWMRQYVEEARAYVLEHGMCPPHHSHTNGCYANHKCRCESCIAAKDAYRAKRREVERARRRGMTA